MRATVLMLLLGISAPLSAVRGNFPDVPRAEEAAAVSDLTEQGRIQGYADGTFRPRDSINRAEFLKILVHEPRHDSDVGSCFTDVTTDAWYAPSVCRAKTSGIVVGYPDGTFHPEEPVTIAEALSMLTRSMHLDVEPNESKPWNLRFERAAEEEGIIDRDRYHPHQELARGLAAVLVSRGLMVRNGVMNRDTEAHLSSGCGQTSPSTPPASVRIGEERRPFLLTVPSSYTPRTPHGLIVAFHGRTNNNAQVRDYMGLDKRSDGFIIAYPQGVSRADGSFSWSDNGDSAKNLRDYALFDALVEELFSQYCIDRDEIFVVGHSLGAWFASTLACARGDVIRGSATLAGGISATTCSGPAAALLFHHTEDKLVPFADGERSRDKKIEQNMCSNETKTVWVGGFECLEYQDCRTGNPVTFCPSTMGHGFEGVGQNTHTWPRPTGEAIMTFFRSLK